MKTKSLITIVLASIWLNTNAQIMFQKTYGGSNQSFCNSIQMTTDSGYVMVGATNSFGLGYWDVSLIKTDAIGEIEWLKTYGGSYDDYGRSVHQTTDGGYIITGLTYSFGEGYGDVYVIKTDSIGIEQWSKTFGNINTEYGLIIKQTIDGGYAISGNTVIYGNNSTDWYMLFVKIDANGNLLWSKTYGENGSENLNSFQPTTDGGYVLIGDKYVLNNEKGDRDVFLIKTDSIGEIQWSKAYGGGEHDYGYSVSQTTDGGLIIAGNTESFGAGNDDIYLIKITSNGDLLWSKTFGNTKDEIGYSVQQTFDEGYVIAGYAQNQDAVENAYLIKTDPNGDLLWSKIYGDVDSIDVVYTVYQTSDSGFILGGWTYGFDKEYYDSYIIKTDANGNSGCYQDSVNTIVSTPSTMDTTVTIICNSLTLETQTPNTFTNIFISNANTICSSIGIQEHSTNSSEIQIYPNPFSNSTTLEFENPKKENHTLTIYNSSGQVVRRTENITDNKVEIERGNLKNGLYFFMLQNKNGMISNGKIMVNSKLK